MRRVFGVDPGSTRHAWAVIDVAPRLPARYVAHGVAADVDGLVEMVRWWCTVDEACELLAIESATEIHSEGHMGTARAVGKALMAQQGHVGELRRVAKDRGLPWVELTANEWRSRVVGGVGPERRAGEAGGDAPRAGPPGDERARAGRDGRGAGGRVGRLTSANVDRAPQKGVKLADPR
jgi:Holliday junction resolvasome RuvABC endonuclease subunit